jgi:putative addiction module component (TIGR02574 family)
MDARIASLTPEEKLRLLEELWDDLSEHPANIPIHEWQIEELDRRKANLEAHPDSALTWEEALRRARGDNGR